MSLIEQMVKLASEKRKAQSVTGLGVKVRMGTSRKLAVAKSVIRSATRDHQLTLRWRLIFLISVCLRNTTARIAIIPADTAKKLIGRRNNISSGFI